MKLITHMDKRGWMCDKNTNNPSTYQGLTDRAQLEWSAMKCCVVPFSLVRYGRFELHSAITMGAIRGEM